MVKHGLSMANRSLSGIDLKRRPSGEYVVLEANSAPVYLDVEQKTGARITDTVIDWLELQRGPSGR